MKFVDFPENEPEIDVESIKLQYYYDTVSLLETSGTDYKYEYVPLTKQADGTYTGSRTLSEIAKPNSRASVSYSFYWDNHYYSQSNSVAFSENMSFTLTFTYKEDYPRVTPDWLGGSIYCFEQIPSNKTRCVGYKRYSYETGISEYTDVVTLYANGGPVENLVGTKDNYKTKQLTLLEEFDGDDAGTYHSTTSKQIAWIVTRDDKCPTEMKQKSDPSYVKVSKSGKITAIAKGDAYVWACRVDPNDKTKVSTTESARVRVHVEDAPAKAVLTLKETPVDGFPVPVSTIDLGIGEAIPVYIYMESNGQKLSWSKWRISVTKGSEFLGVSSSSYSDSFSDHYTDTFKDQVGTFYIKAHNMNMDGKKSKATVTATNLYTGKKIKLNVNINNCVVSVTQPVRGDEALAGLVVPSPTVKTSEAVPNSVLSSYYKTSAQQYLTKTDADGNVIIPKEYETLIRSLTTDKPKIYVTSDENVTKDMIFTERKTGLAVKFTGVKSKSVTASWEMGYLRVNIKKYAAAEKGNIIIVFNTSHDENSYLVIPYQVTSANPENIS